MPIVECLSAAAGGLSYFFASEEKARAYAATVRLGIFMGAIDDQTPFPPGWNVQRIEHLQGGTSNNYRVVRPSNSSGSYQLVHKQGMTILPYELSSPDKKYVVIVGTILGSSPHGLISCAGGTLVPPPDGPKDQPCR